MLIRQLTTMAGPTGTAQPGDLLNVPDPFGKTLVDAGYAEQITADVVDKERERRGPEWSPRQMKNPAGIANKNGVRLSEKEIAERLADGRLVDLQAAQANVATDAERKPEPATGRRK